MLINSTEKSAKTRKKQQSTNPTKADSPSFAVSGTVVPQPSRTGSLRSRASSMENDGRTRNTIPLSRPQGQQVRPYRILPPLLIVGEQLPESLDGIPAHRCIASHQEQRIPFRLRHQHPVEGVSVQEGQAHQFEDVSRLYGEQTGMQE